MLRLAALAAALLGGGGRLRSSIGSVCVGISVFVAISLRVGISVLGVGCCEDDVYDDVRCAV